MWILQLLGGGLYLLNKIFLWVSEKPHVREDREKFRKWRIVSWVVYLGGLPPWIIIFVIERNWIAASVETSGVPSMILGLVFAVRGIEKDPPRLLKWLALLSIPFGLGYSIYDFGGVNTLNQWLEIGLVLGFLVGTYQLAYERASGYLWYILMHVTCAWLMWIQDYYWLFGQQIVSILFIIDAFRMSQIKK